MGKVIIPGIYINMYEGTVKIDLKGLAPNTEVMRYVIEIPSRLIDDICLDPLQAEATAGELGQCIQIFLACFLNHLIWQ